MPTTIHSIAKHLNLSNSTVSKALNGYTDVSETTRELVIKTARELGYQPSAAARNLRRGRTDKIGLFLNTSIEYVVDYLSGIIPGSVKTAQALEKNLLIYTMMQNDPSHLLNVCRAGEIDGVILFSNHYDTATIEALLTENFPFVVMGREIRDDRVSYVVPDYYDGTYRITKYLLDKGHERIAFTTRPELTTANDSHLNGYMDAMHDANIDVNADWIVETRIGPDSGIEPTRTLLSLNPRPTAIVAFHDLLAIDAIQEIQSQGLHVPKDIAVVGFDGLRASMTTMPQITTIQQPFELIGQRVIEIINAQIEDPDVKPIQEVVPVKMLLRGSA